MKQRLNRMDRAVQLGIINCQTPTVNFAGVTAFNTPLAAPAPISPATAVPDPAASVAVDPAAMSKIIPGVPSESKVDPLSPAAADLPKGPSPLDKYAGLFDNAPTVDKDGKPIAKIEATKTLLDAGVVDYTKAAETLDFTKAVTPEIQAKIAKGGEEGVAAMLEAMQLVGANAFIQAGVTASKAGKTSLELATTERGAAVQSQIHLNDVSTLVITANPSLAHPALKPMADALGKQLVEKNPTATPQQIADLTLGYFKELQLQAAPDTSEADKANASNGIEDFFKF